jgi:hypothetical protein
MANRRFIDFPIAASVGDNDIVLIWQDGMNKQTTKGTLIQGAPTSLEGLTDVDIAGLINGQILQYNSTTGKWENVDRTDINLSELGDVSIVSPTNGQVLVYNSSTSKWENSSGGFVPYTGAVTTVDLGAQGLRAGYIRFDTSVVSVPDEQGLVYWDQSRSTAALIMNGVLQHIGQDVFYYVKNSTGSSIAKGTAVRFDGTDGASGHVKIAPFLANGTYPSNYFVGVTAETIANGAFGQVMHFGELSGINTSGYTAGALLYASTTTAGGFQTTAPVAPNNIVLIAAAINSKNNGTILVRPTYGSNINQDEGVKITSPTTGDLLQLQASGLWENKAVATVMSNYVTLDTGQTITGQKFFANNTLTLNTTGNANSTVLTNSIGASTYQSGRNFFGFNTDNHIYFAKSSNTGVNTGILAWTNTATRTYTLKDASGTLAFTSDIPTNPVGGTGTTNYLPKFTGTSTIGNSQVFDNGTNVGIGTASPNAKLDIGSGDIYVRTGLVAVNTIDSYNQTLTIRSNGNTAIFIPNTQNVLLGTTTDAGFKLDVNGTARFTQAVTGTQFNASSKYTLGTLTDGTTGQIATDNTNNYFDYIGSLFFRGAAASNSLIEFTSGGAGKFLTFVTAGSYVNGIGGFRLKETTLGGGSRNWVLGNDVSAFGDFGILQSTTQTGSSYTAPFYISPAGNIGIGTTTDAGFRLDVNGRGRFTAGAGQNGLVVNGVNSIFAQNIVAGTGTSTSFGLTISAGTNSSDIAFQIYNAAENAVRLFVRGDGNVGIGTTAPATNLHTFGIIRSSNTSTSGLGAASGIFQLGDTSNGIWRGAANSVTTAGNFTNIGGFDGIIFTSSNTSIGSQTEAMRITSGGNVLIGTTTDNGARLQVNGITNSAGYRQDTGSLSILNNTTTTFYTNSGIRGLYLVYVSLPAGDGDPANYSAYAIISFDTSTSRILQQTNGGTLFISLGGNSIQARQLSGVTQTIEYRLIKIV